MRISTIAYVLKQGFKNIWRNLRFSLASIATMSACIFLFGLFLSIIMNFRYIVDTAEEGVAVVVYFDKGIKQEEIDQIGADIEKQPEVADVKYISADVAWDEFSEVYLGGDEDMAEGFKDQDNPLANSARFDVYLKEVESQADLVKHIEGLEGVREVKQSKEAADMLSTFNKLVGYVSIVIILILLAVAFFLINNTITMGISIRQEEIGIMKLVGATNGFIRFPFFVEGVTSGLIAAAIASGVVCGSYYGLCRWYAENPSNLSQMFGGQLVPLTDVWYYIVGGFALLGFVLCGIGTATSIRKHLNV